MRSPKTPEERAVIGQKLAIAAGLLSESEIAIGEFIVRKAAIEKPVKAHVTFESNDNSEAELYQERGRKLAIAAGLL
jgi:hypothetical protein